MSLNMYTVLGLILFFGGHVLAMTPLRAQLIDRLGTLVYRGAFSLCALFGLGLIIIGYQHTEYVQLWYPILGYKHLAYTVMPISCILLVASYIRCNIKRLVRHPMLISVMLWSGVHLLANGDVASTVIFASFLIFAVLDIFFGSSRSVPSIQASLNGDLLAVLLGLAVFSALFMTHEYFTGIPLYVG